MLIAAAEATSARVPEEVLAAYQAGNYNAAYGFLAGLAEGGDPEAAYYFAEMHQRGLGVPFNPVKAISWFRRSAEGGYPAALYQLGRMYRTGSGVPQNIFQSLKYLKGALSKGYGEAGLELASIYENGEGVAANAQFAADYRAQAASLGVAVNVEEAPETLQQPASSAQSAATPQPDTPQDTTGTVALSPDVRVLQGRKLALIIGNNSYTKVAALKNSRGDANAMAQALASIGFEVQLEGDLSFADTTDRISLFRLRIRKGDTVFFHFSGHGVEIKGDNLLLPIDVPAPKEGQQGIIEQYGLSAGELIASMKEDGAGLVVAVLDACRENPFAKKGTRGIGGAAGLAKMDPPEGTFVMYSAGANQLALDRLGEDDPESTSVFTRTLIPLLETPNLSLIAVAKKAQQRVKTLAQSVGHQQTPAYYDQIIGEVALSGR